MGSTKSDLVGLIRVYWSLLLGNVLEWYEYAVYGYLEHFIAKQFFKGSSIGVWLGFGVTFLARPLGGLVMGAIGDRWGRSFSVNLSIIGMLVGTCGQGLLPTYESSGEILGTVGLVLLVVLRFVQGLSAAGEISTIATYLTEVSSHHSLCRGTAFVSITANFGFLTAKLMVYGLIEVFGDDAVEQWAWRIPFVLAFIPGVIAVWGRRGVPESSMFLKCQQRDPHQKGATWQRIRDAFKSYTPNIIIGALAMACYAILQYGYFVWSQSYLRSQNVSQNDRMILDFTGRIVQLIFAMPVGWVGDHYGVGSIMLLGTLGMGALSVPFWYVVEHDPTNLVSLLLVQGFGFGLLGTFVCVAPFLFCVELFPTQVRNTAMGISYNIGFSVFGGLAPVLAQMSIKAHPLGPGFLYAAGGIISALSVIVGLLLHRKNFMNIAHVRKQPYLRACEANTADADKELPLDSDSSDDGMSTTEDGSSECSDSDTVAAKS